MKYNSFIAANSSKGFFSYFDELLNDLSFKKVYLIKGGPGCGKSTFMKRVADYSHSKGYTVEQILCSSDPSSLDGIIINEKKIAIIDATSPHAFDLKYPGAFDSIIDLSKFWNEEMLQNKRDEIILLSNKISNKYKKVYGTTRSAGTIFNQIIEISDEYIENNKIISFIKKTVKQNAYTPTENTASINHRFLNSISYKGLFYCCSPYELCQQIIMLDDDAFISKEIISKFASYFNKSGYDAIIYHNPLCPNSKIDHLIIPKLKFGILSTNSVFEYSVNQDLNNIKIVNSKNFIKKDIFNENKNKINFYKRITKNLLDTALIDLSEIKTLHDELEQYYINSMNYNMLNEFTSDFIKQI